MRCFPLSKGVLLLLIYGCLGACVNVQERHRAQVQGDFARSAELYEARQAEVGALSSAELHALCLNYARLKRYRELFECLDRFEASVLGGDRSIVDESTMNAGTKALVGFSKSLAGVMSGGNEPDHIMGSALVAEPWLIRMEAMIELARYDEAIALETDVRRELDNKVRNMKGQLGGLLGGVTKLADSITGMDGAEESVRGELRKLHALLALAHALRGSSATANQHVREIETLAFSVAGFDWADVTPELRRLWGSAYMAIGDCESVLRVVDTGAFEGVIRSVGGVLGQAVLGEKLDLFLYTDLPLQYLQIRCLYETGSVAEARDRLDRLREIPFIDQNGEIYWLMLYDRARIAIDEGEADLAIKLLREAVEVVEVQRSTINTEAGKIGFVGDKQAVYLLLVRTLIAAGHDAEAFEYVERSRARALVDMLAARKDFALPEGSVADAREMLEVLEEREADARVQQTDREGSQVRSARAGEVAAARERIRAASPEFASLVTVSTLDEASIRGELPERTALLEYYQAGDDLYVFVVTRDDLFAEKLDGNGLARDVQRFRRLVESPGQGDYQSLARRLYGRLLEPLEGRIAGQDLLIVAHGPLHYLPFAALRDDDEFVVDRHTLRLLPSASVMQFLSDHGGTGDVPLLALGNPDLGDASKALPFAEQEALEVGKIVPGARVLTRGNATETAVREIGVLGRNLHFATHGEFDAARPMESGLLLAADSRNDGHLTVGELYTLRLDADVVTLSACETALGEIASGDDVVGLTRGFLYAGARAIVASLWSVEDRATYELMMAFYRNLDSMSPPEALRNAQIDLRATHPHPFFWAAFQVTAAP